MIAGDKSAIVAELPEACRDELAAVEFIERQRWGDNPTCPRCKSDQVFKLKKRGSEERPPHFAWRCRACQYTYSVRVGTVLQDSRIPLRHWCFAFWAAASSKKGISALQIKRMTGLNYRSALFLMHRIRYAMGDQPPHPPPKLTGAVEADETYVGGKPRHRGTPPYGWSVKVPVVAVVQRGGPIRVKPLTRINGKTVKQVVLENANLSARLITDDHKRYKKIGRPFKGGHQSVNHTRKEYVRGDVHTNTVEGFFALLKRGIMGTFHSVSEKHLHRYCDEFQYRYSTRKVDDGERVVEAIKRAEGKRLTYKDQIGGKQ